MSDHSSVGRSEHVCPPIMGYLLLIPLRRLTQNPETLLSPFVTSGMTVLDIGPGMGYFTLPLARMVGGSGTVIAVDIQPAMLNALVKRATKNKLHDRIITRLSTSASLGLEDIIESVDFALVFAVVHEIPNHASFFANLHSALKPGACCLLAEPIGHVRESKFAEELAVAQQHGFTIIDMPRIRGCHTAVLQKERK